MPERIGSRANISIRRTLLLYLGGLSLIVCVMLFFGARDYGYRAADRSYDHLLVSSALSIADSVSIVEGHWHVDLPYAALQLLSMAPDDRVFYRVTDAQHHTITGYSDLPAPPGLLEHREPLLFDAPYSGETLRFAVVSRRVSAAAVQDEAFVQVGQTRRAREALAREVVQRALFPIIVLSLLALALVWLGVQRALRPLDEISDDLSRREPSDLKPITEGAPRELGPMIQALNRFMARLHESNEALRTFMAEAAHQMRTPLAALHAQAQLALDEHDPHELSKSLNAIERNASHMSRVLNQLLSDASVTHRANLQEFGTVDLAEVVHQALADAIPQSQPAPRVQLSTVSTPVLVKGDGLLLREALKNVLDNAVKYAGDQGPLEVALTVNGDECLLIVADHGPGIAPAEANVVFQRFVRGEKAAPGGAGLGLAIVQRVVESHRGSIDLSNRIGGGLVVTLRLPRLNS